MSRILVVDDEPKILKIIEHSLSREDFEVTSATDGQQAIEQFQRQDHNLVILDLTLPKIDGFQVCRTIRETSSIPIIILSARNQELDKILSFNLGADDYITKPFSPMELCLRVRAILRRTKDEQKSANIEDLIQCHNGLYIDPSSRKVLLNDRPIELTAKEFDILWVMVKHPNKVFTRKQLLYQIWQNDYIGNEDTVTVLISRLRDKIRGSKTQSSFIQTLRGVGYKFAID